MARMKRLRTTNLEIGTTMAYRDNPTDDDRGRALWRDVRRLRDRATHARTRGHHLLANDLVREASALAAATRQHERAIADAREHLDALRLTVTRFWDNLADDRTLHDLADDAAALLALWDDLDRAESRLMTLELTRP
jgi:hypothetical protein